MIHWLLLRAIFGLELFNEQSLWFRVLESMLVFVVCSLIMQSMVKIPENQEDDAQVSEEI